MVSTGRISDAAVRFDQVIERFTLWDSLKKIVAWIQEQPLQATIWK